MRLRHDFKRAFLFLLLLASPNSLLNGFAGAEHEGKASINDITPEFAKVPLNTTGSTVLRYGNPWKYWGQYPTKRMQLRPHSWSNVDSIVDGWDWSLPPTVKPSSNARIRFGMHGWRDGKLLKMNIPEGVTVVDELWWSWKQLEPEEGKFDFKSLETAIQERLQNGCDGVIIRLLGSVWETGRPEDWPRWRKSRKWMFNRWSAPRWLKAYGTKMIEEKKGAGRVVHMSIVDPVYHQKYKQLVAAFGKSGLPAKKELVGLLICGMSFSNGEEGCGAKAKNAAEKAILNDRVKIWCDAFGPYKHKLINMTGGDAVKYGIGSRDGFVEMYLYLTNNPERGQYIDKNRYLCVNEKAHYVVNGDKVLFGDENEEYRRSYGDTEKGPGRFGPIESFNYRYTTSMLRMLQMRRNYLYTEEQPVIPELLWYVCHALGRKVEDSPDAWCFLRESYIAPWANAKPHQSPGPVKNFERWLHQRDRVGYETKPAVRIPHALSKWWLSDSKRRYDYVARTGKRIGFAVDDRFLNGAKPVAIKVSYYDGVSGAWRLTYRLNGKPRSTAPITTTRTDQFRTAALFIDADFTATKMEFDFEIESKDVPISFVRIIKIAK